MNKKIFGIILCFLLLALSAISVKGEDIDIPTFTDILNSPGNFLNKAEDTNISHVCFILGPITSIYTEIELIEGSESDINRINWMFKRILPRFILPIAFLFIEDLTFKIRFKIEPLIDNGRFFYMTFWGDLVNETWVNESYVFNTIHTVTVNNFTGIFTRLRTRPIRLMPSYFFFAGEYEDIAVIE
jgi:hypothetical protein